MGKITIDPELTSKLELATEQVEVCDDNGRAIGVFLPMELYLVLTRLKKLAYTNVQVPFSEEEIAKLRSEKEGSSLADFWKRMGQA